MPHMGLAERRAVKSFQDNLYPRFKTQLDQIAGFDVPLDVDWASIAIDDYAELYDEAFEKVYFLPLVEAFKAVCIDDMGKDALKAGLQKVVVCYGGSSTDISFIDGVLKFDHYPVSNLDSWGDRKQELQKVLEKNL